MPQQTATTVFDAWRALRHLCGGVQPSSDSTSYTATAAAYPADPRNPGGPVVTLGSTGERWSVEDVAIVGRLDDEAVQAWAAIGQGARDESYGMQIVVRSGIPGLSNDEMLVRVEEIAGAICDALRTARACPDVANVAWWEVLRVVPVVGPGDEGAIGWCEITVGVRGRI